MKIGIDARFYRSSTAGIGRYTRALIRELVKIDHDNEYTIYITPEDEQEYDEEMSTNIQPITNFHKSVISIKHYSIAEQTKFLRILNKEKFDLVHFTNFNHPVLYKRKYIVTIHDLTVMLFPTGHKQKSLFRRYAFKKVMSSAVRNSSVAIAISKSTKKDLIKYLHADQDRIKIIYEGIDERYIKSNNQQLIANSRIKNPYLLFLSQWRPHKGLPELVQAFDVLKQKYKIPHKLIIGGQASKEFPEIPLIIRTSHHFKDIILPGFINEKELPLVYKNADIFVFPSHYEGFGIPPLEAMASGTPVVASNASCIPEILGSAAEYFNHNNPNDMAEKIYKVISNEKLKEQMIIKGFQQVKKYSWAKMAKETLEVYNSVLNNH